jgi:hypothetical protein
MEMRVPLLGEICGTAKTRQGHPTRGLVSRCAQSGVWLACDTSYERETLALSIFRSHQQAYSIVGVSAAVLFLTNGLRGRLCGIIRGDGLLFTVGFNVK